MKKLKWTFAVVSMGCSMALAAQDAAVRVDSVGYDVASDQVVIYGLNFANGPVSTPPYVEVGGLLAPVIEYSAIHINVLRPAVLRGGEYAVYVSRRLPVLGGEPVATGYSAVGSFTLASGLEYTLPQ